MLFQTPEFALLLGVTLAVFYGVPNRYRLHVLSFASLVFYAYSGVVDFVLLVGVIVVTYFLSRRVSTAGSRWPIGVAIALLFASLLYFKYGDFVYENLQTVFGSSFPERSSFLSSALPLGISFYTFQIVAYFVDLRRGRATQARSLVEYTVFVAFFGQLVAGPIMRAKDYIPQLQVLKGGKWADIRVGGLMILTGLLKKVVLADYLALRVDERFAAASFSQPEAWVAAGLFSFQIYFDFSGYVDIALGLARMFGIKLAQNFRTPYIAGNPRDFWNRWHITLSSWFRDYMYIPMGGNRNGKVREIGILLGVMVVAGLWHGAGWTFAIWGLIHAVYLVVHRFLPSERLQSLVPVGARYRPVVYGGVGIGIFFALTVLAWIPFRAPDLAAAAEMYRAAFTFGGVAEWVAEAKWIAVIGALFLLHVAEWWVLAHGRSAASIGAKAQAPARGSVYAALLVLVISF